MSTAWAYCPDLPRSAPSTARLGADESKHASGSRRLRTGDAITLFDGLGAVADGVVGAAADSGELDIAIRSVRVAARGTPEVDLATALPKGDRFATLLEAAGPLGVRRLTPLTCERSVVSWSDSMTARAQRVLVASCKQSRQPWLPTIAPRATIAEAIRRVHAPSTTVLLAHPEGEPISSVAHALRSGTVPLNAQSVLLVVGPEGGLTHSEVSAVLSGGGVPVSLGSAILRVELAVACALAAFRG